MSEPAAAAAAPAAPAPAPAPAPAAPEIDPDAIAPYLDEGLNFRDKWYEDVKDADFDSLRADAAKYKSIPDIIRSAKEHQAAFTKLQQDKGIRVPGEGATDEETAAYRAAVGVPVTADLYDLALPEQMPEGVDFQKADIEWLGEFAHDRGIPNSAVNDLIGEWALRESQQLAGYQAESAEQEQALKDKWGNNWERNNQDVMGAIQLGEGNLENPHFSDPGVRSVIKNLLDKGGFSEDQIVSGQTMGGGLSPGSQAKDIRTNPDNELHGPYWNEDNKYTSAQQEAAISAAQNLDKQQDRLGR